MHQVPPPPVLGVHLGFVDAPSTDPLAAFPIVLSRALNRFCLELHQPHMRRHEADLHVYRLPWEVTSQQLVPLESLTAQIDNHNRLVYRLPGVPMHLRQFKAGGEWFASPVSGDALVAGSSTAMTTKGTLGIGPRYAKVKYENGAAVEPDGRDPSEVEMPTSDIHTVSFDVDWWFDHGYSGCVIHFVPAVSVFHPEARRFLAYNPATEAYLLG
ncbi:hypothetical protein JCM10212_001520 [Sporobolomyces blumeae]